MITVTFGVQINDTDDDLSEVLNLISFPSLSYLSDPEPTATEVGLPMSEGGSVILRTTPEFGEFPDSALGLLSSDVGLTECELLDAEDHTFLLLGNLAGTSGSLILGVGTFIVNTRNESGIRFIGSKFADTLHGGDRTDTIEGANGNDRLFGMGGNDTLIGGTGNDTLNGGGGVDTSSYSAANAAVIINLGLTGVQNTGGGGRDNLVSIENLIGTRFHDTLTGNASDNVLTGGLGNDKLNGGGGKDTASYENATAGVRVNLTLSAAQNTLGAGVDTLTGMENLIGSKFNDTLTGTAGDNVLTGGAGNDRLVGGGGKDTAAYNKAAAGVSVTLTSTTAQNTGGAGTDTLTGIEHLTGGRFDDTLEGNAGNNVLNGGGGNDVLIGGAGNDTLIGGSGTDTADYSAAAGGVTVDVNTVTAQNTGGAGTDTLKDMENLIGSAFNDTLTGRGNDPGTGTGTTDLLDGGDGDDVLNAETSVGAIVIGGAGNDTMVGGEQGTVSYASAGAGVTVLLALSTAQDTGGGGTDTLSGFENLTGSAFNDTLSGDIGDNVIDGGAGIDTLTFASFEGFVNIDLSITDGAQSTGSAGNDTLIGIENLIGSDFDDTLSGNSSNNVLDGGDGNDTVSYSYALSGVTVDLSVSTAQDTGGEGSDTLLNFENLTGSSNDDTLAGNAGNNVLDGGGNTDTLSYAGAASGVTADLSVSTAQNTGGAGTDTLANFENLIGSAFDDTLSGDGNHNFLSGEAGNDTLSGADGNDLLDGGIGNDTLRGGASGDDVLDGGDGTDTASYIDATAFVDVDLSVTIAQETLGAGTDTLTDVENLTGGNFNDFLTGNSDENVLSGGDGDDTLTGAGGDDTLTGGDGNDFFVFNSLSGADTLTDFDRSHDWLEFENSVYTTLGGSGTLNSALFLLAGETPAGGDDYLIYDETAGELYYDATGAGLFDDTGGILVASLGAGNDLFAADILVI